MSKLVAKAEFLDWDYLDDDSDPRWAQPALTPEGMPAMVHCQFSITSLSNINTASGTSDIEILLWLRWRDNRLNHRPIAQKLPDELWSPRLRLSEGLAGF